MSATIVRLARARVPARGNARHRVRLARAARASCPAGSARRRSSSPSSPRSARCSTCSTIPRRSASSSTAAWTYAASGDFSAGLAILVDPLSLFMCLVVTGVSFLIHLYSVAYMGGDRGYARYFAYLNFFVFSMLAAGPGGELRDPDRRLGVRRRGLVPPDLVLVPPHHRRGGRDQGVRDQRDRRRRARGRGVPDPRPGRLAQLPARVRGGRERVRAERRHARRGLPAPPGGRVRQVRTAAAPHLAARTPWRAPRPSRR